MADEKYISKIQMPGTDGQLYKIKDEGARELIETISAGSVVWAGVTTTELTDGGTTSTIIVNGKEVLAKKGLMAAYVPTGETQAREFIYNGEIWQELGGLGMLKAFAYADQGEVSITPEGSNASSSVSFAAHTKDKVLGEATTFSVSDANISFSGGSTATVLKSDVTATVPKTTGTTKYLKVAHSGTAATVNKGYTPSKKSLETASAATVTYAGEAGESASWSASVNNETLSFSWTTNTPTTLPTFGSQTVATGALKDGSDIVTGITTTGTTSVYPSVSLSTADSTSSGAIGYVASVTEDGTNNVSFATSGHTATAITDVGTGTVSGQSATASSTDLVDAITVLGAATAAAQKFTGTAGTHTVTPKT